jgi:hypothetical protein
VRGGSWKISGMLVTGRLNSPSTNEDDNIGFRVATLAVPEPSTTLLAFSGLAVLAAHRRSRR